MKALELAWYMALRPASPNPIYHRAHWVRNTLAMVKNNDPLTCANEHNRVPRIDPKPSNTNIHSNHVDIPKTSQGWITDPWIWNSRYPSAQCRTLNNLLWGHHHQSRLEYLNAAPEVPIVVSIILWGDVSVLRYMRRCLSFRCLTVSARQEMTFSP